MKLIEWCVCVCMLKQKSNKFFRNRRQRRQQRKLYFWSSLRIVFELMLVLLPPSFSFLPIFPSHYYLQNDSFKYSVNVTFSIYGTKLENKIQQGGKETLKENLQIKCKETFFLHLWIQCQNFFFFVQIIWIIFVIHFISSFWIITYRYLRQIYYDQSIDIYEQEKTMKNDDENLNCFECALNIHSQKNLIYFFLTKWRASFLDRKSKFQFYGNFIMTT